MSVVDVETLLRDAPLPLIAARIRRARKALELTHDQLGELADGMPRQQLIKLEQGKNRPRLQTLERLAHATNRDPRWFVDPDIEPSPFPDDDANGGHA